MKKAIKIDTKHLAAIQAELDKVQARCRVRTITAEDILTELDKIPSHYHIPKKDMVGTDVWLDLHAQKFPNAYKGVPESTQVHAEYRSGGWYLVALDRYQVTTHAWNLTLSESAELSVLFNINHGLI